jgi:hypothetical protein
VRDLPSHVMHGASFPRESLNLGFGL